MSDGVTMMRKDLLKEDQRDAWWVNYNKVKHGMEKGMPETLENPRFQELTAEPLLAYFVATSGFTGTDSDNRNKLYEKLFDDVAKRSHAGVKSRPGR